MKTLKIGRDLNSDIILNSSLCSREHALLTIFSPDNILLKDTSNNGTLVNGAFFKNIEIAVKKGDTILFAGIESLDWSRLFEVDTIKEIKNTEYIATEIKTDIESVDKVEKTNEVLVIEQKPKTQNPIIDTNTPYKTNNPTKKKNNLWAYILGFCIIASVSLYYYNTSKTKKNIVNPTEIYSKYKNTVGLVEVNYYIKIHTSKIDIYLGLDENKEMILKKSKAELYPFVSEGTAFFISDDGKMITNRHVIEPWKNDDEMNDFFNKKIKPEIKKIFSDAGYKNEKPTYTGELENIYVYPNGVSYSPYNKITCSIHRTSSKEEIDLACIQTNNRKLPVNMSFITQEDISSSASDIEVNTNAYIIGFPMGDALAKNESNDLNCSSTQGYISQAPSSSYIQYSAPTASGASGSPVFDQYGKLIAINYLGSRQQSFNRGILAKHLEYVR
jgi:S1-C subfamily serine protease